MDVEDFVEAATALFEHEEDPAYVFRWLEDPNDPVETIVETRLEQDFVTGDWRVTEHGDTLVTNIITANIRPGHLQRDRQTEGAMTSKLNKHIGCRNAVPGDERGHLLAYSLGGSNEPYNIVPQYNTVNRWLNGLESPWIRLERRIRNFLSQRQVHSDRWVQWTVIVHYSANERTTTYRSLRPTGFTLNVVFNDGTRILEMIRNYHVDNTPGNTNQVLRHDPCGTFGPSTPTPGDFQGTDLNSHKTLPVITWPSGC